MAGTAASHKMVVTFPHQSAQEHAESVASNYHRASTQLYRYPVVAVAELNVAKPSARHVDEMQDQEIEKYADNVTVKAFAVKMSSYNILKTTLQTLPYPLP